MKFFYADSLDLVDPVFDFEAEKSRNPKRVPQRDDVYAHELMEGERPYDGLLVSKALFRVGGGSVATGKYSQAQRKRFEREGAPRFLRFPKAGRPDPERFPILGDCGAFAYIEEPEPPLDVDELIEFYEQAQFTHGISLDHVVRDYDLAFDDETPLQPSDPGVDSEHAAKRKEALYRQELSLANASEFLSKSRGGNFVPIGAAHGWSPRSYRRSVRELVAMGYDYIALGGLARKRTEIVREVLLAVRGESLGRAKLHLLGVVRPELFDLMKDCGVASFDSSSPVFQAFNDAKDNYYSRDSGGHYTAVRIPQVDKGVPMRRIREGRINQADAIAAEAGALRAFRDYGTGDLGLKKLLAALRRYDDLLGDGRKTKPPWDRMERTLRDRPWADCPCTICSEIGIEVILFRGGNRNRRRGFHNLWWTQRVLETWRENNEA